MFEAKLTVVIPGLEALAAALNHAPLTAPAKPVPQAPVAVNPTPIAPGPVAGAPSVPPAPTYTPPVATSPAPAQPPVAPAPTYTHEQVGRAGADLVAANPGLMPTLMGLMQRYGVQQVTELKPDQLGAFATDLRGLGAKL